MKLSLGPREKLLKYGVESLTDEELLAILIATGNKKENVIDLSKRILEEISSIDFLLDTTIDELMKFDGIGLKKASIIISAMELNKRIQDKKVNFKRIMVPRELYEYVKNDFIGLYGENLFAIYLNSNFQVLSKIKLFTGSNDQITLDSREIIKRALKLNSYFVCLVHNHPSGSLYPSEEDLKYTSNIESKLAYLNLKLFDHLIVTSAGYYSIRYDIRYFDK